MKKKSKKLNYTKKIKNLCADKSANVKNVKNIKYKKVSFLDLVSEDVWEYMNEVNESELK